MTTAEYSKQGDPFRNDEERVRKLVAAAGKIGSFHIRQQGRFTRGDITSYASVEVLCWRDELDRVFEDKPCSLHKAVVVSEGSVPTVRLIDGVYDLTAAEAARELAKR